MSASSEKSRRNAWGVILWLFAGYFFLGFPAAFFVGLDWLSFGDAETAFAPLIWMMEQAGPLGKLWAEAIEQCYRLGASLR